jgi:mannose-6-phosphate isomerase-like protein (cupin superfamily)
MADDDRAVAAAGETAALPATPDYTSASGGAEIRLLPNFPAGEIAHAVTRPGQISDAAVLDVVTEMFFVLGGEGQLWRSNGENEQVVTLRPGRLTLTPPGILFQYCCTHETEALRFLVISAPCWQPELWKNATNAYFGGDRAGTLTLDAPGDYSWRTTDLHYYVDYAAPDNSEIRLLDEVDEGGVAHCRLPAGATSKAVKHKAVAEIWYTLAGFGQIARRARGGAWEVRSLCEGIAVTIPAGVAFQFQATSSDPLELVVATFPRWPGPDEAVPVDEPYWLS